VPACAFLLEMLGSAIRINHWAMDTSLLHHIPPAPANDPDRPTTATYLTIGLLLALLGTWRFTRRDIHTA
jgi:putative exporter of polyketide antibiotics